MIIPVAATTKIFHVQVLKTNYNVFKFGVIIWNKLQELNIEFLYLQESSKSIQIEAFHVFKVSC